MELVIDADNHKDTFVNMEQWTKGVVWVNGINLGRYWAEEGPATTLYLPGNDVKQETKTLLKLQPHSCKSEQTK